MARVTSKLQITLPKALAERFGIAPGDEFEWEAAGDVIRIVPSRGPRRRRETSVEERLRRFDDAEQRQRRREQASAQREEAADRGWTRDELYDRGRSR